MNSVLERLLLGDSAKAAASGRQPGESVPNLLGVDGGLRGRVSNKNARRHVEAYGGTDAIDWVTIAVDKYAQTASNSPYHFERDGKRLRMPGEQGDGRSDPAAPPDLVALFARPNPYMDYTELLELAIIDLLLAGEFIWLKYKQNEDGKPLALYRLSPALVDVEPGDGFIKKYVYNPPGGKAIEYTPDQIVHVKRPNPHDPYRGLGVIAGSPRAFDIELALVDQTANYYENGTRLAGVVQSERAIPDSTFQKITRQFAALYSGRRNVGKVAMLERGLRWQSISANAAEAQLLEAAKWGLERTMYNFRIPLPLIGLVGGSTDRQAVREAQRIYSNETMRPFLNRIQKQVSFALSSAWGLDYVIEHEYVMPIEDKIDLATGMAAVPGVQVKDLRKQLELPPLAEQNPEWAWIDNAVLNLPGQDREDGGHGDNSSTPPQQGGRPAKGTVLFPDKPGDLPASAAVLSPQDSAKALADTVAELRRRAAEGVS